MHLYNQVHDYVTLMLYFVNNLFSSKTNFKAPDGSTDIVIPTLPPKLYYYGL